MKIMRHNNSVYPTKYSIQIKPIFPTCEHFEGVCTIMFKCSTKKNTIVLDAEQLSISNIDLHDTDSGDIIPAYIDVLKLSNKIHISTMNIPDSCSVTVRYTGNINQSFGLVKTYDEGKNKAYPILYTLFEPSAARRCFPCFDHPSHRAIFQLSLLLPTSRYSCVLSNTDINDTRIKDTITIYNFKPSQMMATYLFSFYVGNQDLLIKKIHRDIDIRVYCDKKFTPKIDIMICCLDYITDTYYVKYPYEILQIVPVPNMRVGGMENIGLIMINEKFVSSSPDDKDEFIHGSYVLCHEIAHQWFGNYAMISSWNDIWLNESLSSWVGWRVMKKLFPTSKLNEQIFSEYTLPALESDMSSVRAIVPMSNNKNPNEFFDKLSYTKGMVVVDTLMDKIGETAFNKCMSLYLYNCKGSNATTKKFITVFNNQHLMEGMLSKYINNVGYPLIVCEIRDGGLFFSQQVHSLNDDKTVTGNWCIPLMEYGIILEPSMRLYMSVYDIMVRRKIGFYRIVYKDITLDESMFESLQIDEIHLAALLSDMFSAMITGHITFVYYMTYLLAVCKKLKTHLDYFTVFLVIHDSYKYLEHIEISKNILKKFVKAILPYIAKYNSMLSILTGKTDPHNESKKITDKLLIYMKNGSTIKYFMDRYIKWKETPDYDMDCLGSVLMAVFFAGDKEQSCFLSKNILDRLIDGHITQTEIKMIEYMDNINYYSELLQYVTKGSGSISKATTLLEAAGKNIYFKKYMFHLIYNNWRHLHANNRNEAFYLIDVLKSTKYMYDDNYEFTTSQMLESMKSISPELSSTIDSCIKQVRLNTSVRGRDI